MRKKYVTFIFICFLLIAGLVSCIYAFSSQDEKTCLSWYDIYTPDFGATLMCTPIPAYDTFCGEILPYRGLEDSLTAIGLSIPQALEIANALRPYVDFTTFTAGDLLQVDIKKEDSTITKVIYKPNKAISHLLMRNPQGEFEYQYEKLPTEKKYRLVEGSVENNLNSSLAVRDDVYPKIRQAANLVMESTKNFRDYARNGDTYRLLIEEEFLDGEKLPGGIILSVTYTGKKLGKTEAFFFQDPEDEKSALNGFYSRTFQAYASAGLRYPVNHIHITSSFGMRIHPVTGKRHLHNGVDFGGRIGDAIFAASHGKVTRTGESGYNGKFIVISHPGNNETWYLHLHRIQVKPGQQVTAGRVIGQLGNTGRSTGPHVHFGLRDKRGIFVNPLRTRMYAEQTLPSGKQQFFNSQIMNIEKKVSELSHP